MRLRDTTPTCSWANFSHCLDPQRITELVDLTAGGDSCLMKDLKERAIRGGFAKVCAQAANFLLRLGSVMVLARLLTPRDFGLVGMVTALTGVLSLFRDFGLSSAAIQRATVTEEQISTLFWINMLVG